MSLMDKINSEDGATTPVEETKVDDGTVKVPTSMLEQLQKQIDEQNKKIEDLEKRKTSKVVEEDDDDDEKEIPPLVRFKLWEDKICVGYNKTRGIWKSYDKERREDIMMQEITLRDQKTGEQTTMEVNAKEFFEEAREIKIPVIKYISKPTVEKKGYTTIKTVSREGYRTIDTGKKVRQKVTGLDTKAVVEMPYGKVLEIDIDFINM